MKEIFRFDKRMLGGGRIHVRKKTEDFCYPLHWHDYMEIILYRGCEGICELNGNACPVVGDCLFFLTPRDFHRIDVCAREGAVSFVVSFSDAAVDRRLLQTLLSAPRRLTAAEDLVGTVERLYETFGKDSPARLVREETLLNLLLCEIIERGETLGHSGVAMNPYVRGALDLIEETIGERLTLSDAAAKVCLSPAYFSGLFHRETGIPFYAYLQKTRVEYACRLLEEGDRSVLDVGLASGFQTPSAFIRAFRAEVGCTPSDYRQKHKLP